MKGHPDDKKYKQFKMWEWEYAKPLFDSLLVAGGPLLGVKSYFPEDSIPLVGLLDRWDVEPLYIIENVKSGEISVAVGWEAEKRRIFWGDMEGKHLLKDHNRLLTFTLFVQNKDLTNIESKYPQLKEEAEKWEYSLDKYHQALTLCRQARGLMFRAERNAYSIEGGLRLECSSNKKREAERAISATYENKIQKKDEEISLLKVSSQNGTIPSRSRWYCSMEAGCAAVAHAIASGQKWHKETKAGAGFLDLMKKLYTGEGLPLSEAEEIAWKALPQEYKAGAGNPDKKKNIQTLETPNIPQ